MIIHYKKDRDSPDKMIRNVQYIGIIDGLVPAVAVLRSGREIIVRLDRIEAILDDEVGEKGCMKD